VDVEGIGAFTFARRTMRDEISVQIEYAKLLGGVEPTPWLSAVCGWLSVLSVLTVRAPEGWSTDPDAMDPLDEEVYARLSRVHGALVEKERSFRRGAKPGSQAGGAAAA
jgi:hypothetical protein